MRIIKLITTVLLSALLLTACNGTSDSYNTKVTVDYEIDSATSAHVHVAFNSMLSDLRSGGNPDSVIALPDKPYISVEDIITYLNQTHTVVSPMLHRIGICRNLIKQKTENALDVLDYSAFLKYKNYFD